MTIKQSPYRVHFPISGLSILLIEPKRSKIRDLGIYVTSLVVVRIYSYSSTVLRTIKTIYNL